jgi:hypothetical protein
MSSRLPHQAKSDTTKSGVGVAHMGVMRPELVTKPIPAVMA